MKKKVYGKKLGRERSTRRALFRSLIKSFVKYGKITTTKAKAKAIVPNIDKLIKLTSTKDVAKIRKAYSYLGNDSKTINNLVQNISKTFKNRQSGFTRIINLPRRKGDNAEVVRLEWSQKPEVEGNTSQKDKKTAKQDKKTKTDKTNKVEEKKKTLKERLSSLTQKTVKPKK